jgi:hypothetical protein
MDVWGIHLGNLFKSSYNTCVVFLGQNFFHQRAVAEFVDDPGSEIASKALACWHIEHETWRGERAVLHAASTCTTSYIKAILLWRSYDTVAVASKTSVRAENLRIKGSCRCGVLGLSIERVVPVAIDKVRDCLLVPATQKPSGNFRRIDLRLATSPPAFISQRLFICGDKVAVPQNKMTLYRSDK